MLSFDSSGAGTFTVGLVRLRCIRTLAVGIFNKSHEVASRMTISLSHVYVYHHMMTMIMEKVNLVYGWKVYSL